MNCEKRNLKRIQNKKMKIPSILRNSCQVLELTSFRLYKVPNLKFFKNLKGVYLQHNNIKTLKRENFEFILSIEVLDLSYNKINQIDDKIFNKNKNLKIVNLSYNCLNQNSNFGFLLSLRNINELDLSQNYVENFSIDKFLSFLEFPLNHLRNLKITQKLKDMSLFMHKKNFLKKKSITKMFLPNLEILDGIEVERFLNFRFATKNGGNNRNKPKEKNHRKMRKSFSSRELISHDVFYNEALVRAKKSKMPLTELLKLFDTKEDFTKISKRKNRFLPALSKSQFFLKGED